MKCSLILLSLAIAGIATADPWEDLANQVSGAKNADAQRRIVQDSPLFVKDKALRDAVSAKEDLGAYLRLRTVPSAPENNGLSAKGVKQELKYRDTGVRSSSNWLSSALQRLLDLLKNLVPKPRVNPGRIGDTGPWLSYLMWVVLISAAAIFAFFAARLVARKKRSPRQSSALLEEDEPERSRDEWLTLADELEQQGEYRKAVRALYVASLLKLDEARLVRFDRGQTNWEHLARLESNAARPPDLDFRPPTRRFDWIWYGSRSAGSEDVQEFRRTYQQLTSLIEVPA